MWYDVQLPSLSMQRNCTSRSIVAYKLRMAGTCSLVLFMSTDIIHASNSLCKVIEYIYQETVGQASSNDGTGSKSDCYD